jgi:hypothetical protein
MPYQQAGATDDLPVIKILGSTPGVNTDTEETDAGDGARFERYG